MYVLTQLEWDTLQEAIDSSVDDSLPKVAYFSGTYGKLFTENNTAVQHLRDYGFIAIDKMTKDGSIQYKVTGKGILYYKGFMPMSAPALTYYTKADFKRFGF